MCDKETIDAIDKGKLKVVPKWERLLTLWGLIVSVLTALVWAVLWYASVGATTFDDPQQKADVIRHAYDEDVHMKYQDKVEQFVPRVEYNSHLEQYKTMNNKLDKIYDLLLKRE